MKRSPWLPRHQWWLEVYLASRPAVETRNMSTVADMAKWKLGSRPSLEAIRKARLEVGLPERSAPSRAPFRSHRPANHKAARRERIKVLAELRQGR